MLVELNSFFKRFETTFYNMQITIIVYKVVHDKKPGTFGRGVGRPGGSFCAFWYTSANTWTTLLAPPGCTLPFMFF